MLNAWATRQQEPDLYMVASAMDSQGKRRVNYTLAWPGFLDVRPERPTLGLRPSYCLLKILNFDFVVCFYFLFFLKTMLAAMPLAEAFWG